MNFDTGSADIWVPASDCHRCGGKRHYESSLSRSFRTEFADEKSTWQVRYGDGSSVSGIIGHDTITVGNAISLDDYSFGIAKEQAHGFARDPFMDGLFGLAFPALSAINNKTSFVQTLHQQGKIKEPIVSFWLGRSTAENDKQGEVINASDIALQIRHLKTNSLDVWRSQWEPFQWSPCLHSSGATVILESASAWCLHQWPANLR